MEMPDCCTRCDYLGLNVAIGCPVMTGVNGRATDCPLVEVPEDVQPVKHGRWVLDNPEQVLMHCSNCNWHNLSWKWKYCPNCGALMGGMKTMYEELIRGLRDRAEFLRKANRDSSIHNSFAETMSQAADAIEQLIKERDDWKTTAKLERDGMWEWFEAYQKDVPMWISAAKRLPEENGFYLCLYEAKQPGGIAMDEGLSILQYLDNKWRLNEIYTVTHWMPLPELPEVTYD